jgi:dihydrolipoamide dehydrogenase
VPIVEIRVPDIGDFEQVEVIELIARVGEPIAADASLVALESDKATLEIPAPRAGILRELCVRVGDRVSEGDLLARLDVEEQPASAEPARSPAAESQPRPQPQPQPQETRPAPRPTAAGAKDERADVVVLGGGPGGYTAAFRAADLGKRVVLVEREARLGGVCLNIGCIPSKALLHLAQVIDDARDAAAHGIEFGAPRLDLARIREFQEDVVGQLVRGLEGLAKRRKVEVVRGSARFSAAEQISVDGPDGTRSIGFRDCIVAVGSRPVELPGLPDDPRIWDSTGALQLETVPERLLIVGGGIIGLEMATVYHALGAHVSVVELLEGLVPGCDRDLVAPLERRLRARYEGIWLGTKLARIEARPDGLHAFFEGPDAPQSARFDRVLVAVGRRPNADRIDAGKIGLQLDPRGFLPVDARQQTRVPHVYAIGDVVGGPLLAHKAMHEGRVAAEVIAGLPAAFDARSIPSVAYTDPELAWTGLTEERAQREGIAVDKAVFPWSASGRALGMGRAEGLTKLLFDPESHRVLGAGMVGRNAGELIAEIGLAIELGADAEDLALTIHPHPTLSESVGLSAELAEGTITDLYAPRRRG